MIITISGTPGSGKSTIASNLVKLLQAERIYVGGIRRELAREKGMTLEELNQYALTHPETDVDVDQQAAHQAREAALSGKTIIVEGRTQFHFLPDSVKIYIKVDFEEGARRIWDELQDHHRKQARNEGTINSFEEMKRELRQRQENDTQRYEQYYHLNLADESQYDLVMDTTSMTAEEATQKVLHFLRQKTSINL
ncbi:AAA family ATPase [Candidatus Woesearchaeota archaeon]|nr:AAA family ATPase [Candidatus Woesearchaeota archaeon]